MTEFSDEIDIAASAEKIWSILTDASGYASWNPEVKGIEGTFSKGARLTLHRDSAPEKSTVEVTEFDAPRRLTMTSSGGMAAVADRADQSIVIVCGQLRADAEQGREPRCLCQIPPVIVDAILQAGVAFRVSAWLALEDY